MTISEIFGLIYGRKNMKVTSFFRNGILTAIGLVS